MDFDGSGSYSSDETISYDAIGNPTSYLGNTLTWFGRKLTGYSNSNQNITYTYDADGYRASKTVNGQKTTYQYVNGMLVYECRPDMEIFYLYDSYSKLTGIRLCYNNSETEYNYYATTNAQGDVLGIYNANGDQLAAYEYDAWGNVLSVSDANGNPITSETHIAHINPFRYRGYYFDSETGLYYLNSRYYNAEVGRFISADGYVQTGQGMLDKNMFAYCGNNPVNREDSSGNSWKDVKNWLSKTWNSAKSWAKNIFGASSSTTTIIAQTKIPSTNKLLPITLENGAKTTQTISKQGDSSKPISVYCNKNLNNPIKSSSVGLKLNVLRFTLDISIGIDNFGVSGSLTNGNITNSFGLKVNFPEMKAGIECSTDIQWDNTTETTYTNISANFMVFAAAYSLLTTGQPAPSVSPEYSY